jgi:hypothetical protein
MEAWCAYDPTLEGSSEVVLSSVPSTVYGCTLIVSSTSGR